MTTQIQVRRDTAANWLAADPVLAAGEPGHELETGLVKFGDGVTAWSGLTAVNSAGGGGTFKGVSLTKSVVQSVAAGATASVTWDGEEFDSHGFHDNTTNPERITIPTGEGGTYLLGWCLLFNTVAADKTFTMHTAKTGTGQLANGGFARPHSRVGGVTVAGQASALVNLVAADYLLVRATNGDSVARDLAPSASGACFWAYRVA